MRRTASIDTAERETETDTANKKGILEITYTIAE